MSSLGELFFSLGLDSQKFDDAIKEAKKKVAELTGEASITINADASKVAEQVRDEIKEVAGKGTKFNFKFDESSKKSVEELIRDIADAEKELERLKSKESWNTSAIERQDGFIKTLKNQLDEAKTVKVAASEVKEAIDNITQPSQTVQHVVSEEAIADVKALTDAMKSLNEQMEVSNRLREGQQRANAQSKEEAKQRKISAQWLNETRRQKKEIAQLQEEEEAMRSSVSSKWIEEARQKNAELRKEESAAAKQRVADAKASNKALQSQLSQLFKLEEAIKKLQSLRIRLNFSGIDQNSENFKKAASALDAYIDKLQQLQGSGRALSKREVSSVLGMSMKSVIDESDRYVKEQKVIEKSLIKALSEGSASSVVIDKKTTAMNKFQKAIIGTTNWASQLNNQLGNTFSIYAIERFVRSLYTVGGEFQKQQIALQNMIGDTDKADVVFDRMKDLAVTSPFTFSELASYTKQMSAYGIEYEELYDTTKRLADISAGVGVDMSRIILAYGQVRSAEVLRGQELRQFTEAGIPLVAELAKRLEEVRGKSVAVGEVFDAISKREISFDMVKDVLFDMTDPGGRFFETQERLAESLAGKWSNLKDAWDIMIADIANGNNSTLKSLAEVTAWLVKNWEAWLPLITGAAAALGSYRAVMAVVIPLQQAFNILTKANPWIAIASGVVGAAAAIYGYASNTKTAADELKELNRELDKNIQKNKENEQTANRYLDSLRAQNTSEEQRIRLLEELKSLYPDIFKDMKAEQVLLADTIDLKKRMAEATKAQNLSEYDNLITEAENRRIKLQKKYDDAYIQTGATGKRNRWYNELEAVKDDLRRYRKERIELEQELDWKGKVSALGDKSTLDDYINLYGEVGKAIKVLRDNGIKDETLVKPEQGIPLDEYYDKLNTALKKQKDIMTKFGADTTMHQNAETIKKVYESAIKSIGGVIGGNQKPTGGKSEAEEAAERDAKAYLDTLKDKLRKIGSQWDLYKELFEATGDKNLSMKIAFDGQIPAFDSYIEHLKGKMEEEIKKRGLGISVSDLLEMGKEGIANKVNDKTATAWTEEVAKNLNALIDAYNDANNKLRKESIDTFLDIIKNSKDFAQQIADVERQLQEELKLLAKNYGVDSEEYDRRSKEAIKRAEEKKSSINLEKFKKESNWVNVFSNLEDVPLDVIDDMIDKIEKLKAETTDMKFNELKELADALKRLRSEILNRNPFKLIIDSYNDLKKNTGDEEAWRNLGKGLEGAVQIISNVISKVAEVMDALGVTVTEQGKKLVDGLTDLGTGLAHAFEGYGSQRYDKMAMGFFEAAAGMAKVASTLFRNDADKEAHRQYLLDIIRLQTEYNSALIDTKLLNEDVWGNTQIKDSINAVNALSQAVRYYNELVDKEVEVHQDPTGGFWKRFGAANFWNPLGWYALGASSLKKEDSGLAKIKDNLRYITQTPNMFRHTETTNLVDWLKENGWGDLFDKDGRLNLDLANSIKDWDRLTGETKEYLNNLIEAEEAIRKSEEALDDYLSETFGDLGNQLSDAIVDAFRNGTDAAEGFKNSVVAVLEDVGAQIMRSVFLTEVFSEYEKDLKKIYGDYADHQDKKKFTEDLSSATKDFVDDTKDSIEAGTSWLEQYKKLMKEQGFDVFTPEESESSLSKGVQSITEGTADILASYVNAMRVDVSVNRTLFEQLVNESVPRMSVLAEAQLTQLRMVADNTRRNADAADRIYELVNRVVDRGSGKLKVG